MRNSHQRPSLNFPKRNIPLVMSGGLPPRHGGHRRFPMPVETKVLPQQRHFLEWGVGSGGRSQVALKRFISLRARAQWEGWQWAGP